MLYCLFLGPDPCGRVRLFSLDFGHLVEWVSFARDAKQHHAERNSTEAVAEKKNHNALAQLSVSFQTCKPKPPVFKISIALTAAATGSRFYPVW
jgi:hypothetical protein